MQLPGESQRPAQVTPVEKCAISGGICAGRGDWIISGVGSLVRMSQDDGAVPLTNTRLEGGAKLCPGDWDDIGGKERSCP